MVIPKTPEETATKSSLAISKRVSETELMVLPIFSAVNERLRLAS